MRQNKETVKRLGNLRRSVALALVFSGGASVLLPGMVGATSTYIYGTTSGTSGTTDASKAVASDATLVLTGAYYNAYGGYSAASGTAVTGNSLDTGTYTVTEAVGG